MVAHRIIYYGGESICRTEGWMEGRREQNKRTVNGQRKVLDESKMERIDGGKREREEKEEKEGEKEESKKEEGL